MSDEEKLFEENMKLAYYLIHRYYPNFSNDEDVKQQALLGLWNAVKTFDPDKSQFSTYAAKCILNSIRHYFRSKYKQDRLQCTSLDKLISSEDGDGTLHEFIGGDPDLNVDYIDYQLFYNRLTKSEQELLELSLEHTQSEIAEMWGTNQVSISRRFRKIKNKWRKFHGDD